MIASVCLEQKLIQPSLQKTSKDIWGFARRSPFISEFLLQRRGWHVCKHPCSAPSAFPSPPAGSCSSPLWARLWEVIWVFLPEEGMLLWEYVAMHSGHLTSRTALCSLGGFTVQGEPGTVSSPPSHRQSWEGWWGSAWNSDPSPTAAFGRWLLGSPPPPSSPPSSIYFPNLVRLPCSSLIGPWKIIAVWKSWAGWNFLFGKWLLAPFSCLHPGVGQGLYLHSPHQIQPCPADPQPCSASLFTLQLASLQVLPCKLLGFFQPVYFPSAKCSA